MKTSAVNDDDLGRAQISARRNDSRKTYEPPTLQKRAALSAITSEDSLQISAQPT
jgi:hypothetical protein